MDGTKTIISLDANAPFSFENGLVWTGPQFPLP